MLADRFYGIALALGLMTTTSGCLLLPISGPYSTDIRAENNSMNSTSYALVSVTGQTIPYLRSYPEESIHGVFSDRRAAQEVTLGVGDIIAVTIFEAAAGGLFIPSNAGARPGNFVELPAQQVDKNGNISVPYAGLIPASGRRISDIQHTIEERLRQRAIEPQVVISLKEQRATQVSVLGEVNSPARFPANPAGERILDAIARAGGPKGQGYETFVTLQRNGKQARTYFNRLVSQPSNNVFVQPGDTIVVSREARRFVMMGASGENGHYDFQAENLMLSEALGKAGGLLDERADPSAVFVYRMENRRTVERMGTDISRFQDDMIPVIYTVNLKDPSGFFMASQFPVRNGDIVYIANAAGVEISKFLNLVRMTALTARTVESATVDINN